ncbi:MAG: DUF2306 domain-containing protein, partial [Bacteroidetes bacterium]|nr:DUF2306 domain-containing protein [Bacteroidota bacterium]
MNTQKSSNLVYRVAWYIVIFLAIIGIAAVLRRALTLSGILTTRVNPKFGEFDIGLRLNPVLTFVHIIAGGCFMVLMPLQFIPKVRANHLWFHRWSGRILVFSGLIIGVSAITMSFKTTIGGATETSATLFFATLFLFSLFKGFYHIRRREVALHREWMIRMFAIGLAVATIRPIVGMFFAFSKLSPHEFFGIAFWIGFTAHLVAAEVWI